ncbi:type II toxin-antitoxin system PemK/MazF family toxin [Halostagnicola bangensis]
MTADETPIYEPGDVVYGADPYKSDEDARPWLVISNHKRKPFYGEQYIALSLTTRTWMEDLVEIPEDAWIRGGTPDDSRIIPWAIQSIDSEDIDFWQGRLDDPLVTKVTDALVDYIQL